MMVPGKQPNASSYDVGAIPKSSRSSDGTSPSVIPSLLDQNAMEVDVRCRDVARKLSGYLGYSAIIFDNVPGHLVGEHKMTVIEQAVKSFGTGFMMVGGDESYLVSGGYFQIAD